jgi:hypothetical protein
MENNIFDTGNLFIITLMRDGKLYKNIEIDKWINAWLIIDHLRYEGIVCDIVFGTKILGRNDRISKICGIENVKLEIIYL